MSPTSSRTSADTVPAFFLLVPIIWVSIRLNRVVGNLPAVAGTSPSSTRLWGPDAPDRSTSIRNLVSALRKALAAAGATAVVTTEPGIGDRWEPAPT